MATVKAIMLVYLFSLCAVAVSAWQGINVQSLLRVPLVGVRWIDVAILFVTVLAGWEFWKLSIGGREGSKGHITSLQMLIVTFVCFEVFQLIRSFGVIESQSQFSLFSASLSVSVLLLLSCVDISPQVHSLLLKFSFYGSYVLIFTVLMQVLGLSEGFAFRGQEDRVEFDIPGARETVYAVVLIPLVLLHGLISSSVKQATSKVFLYKIAIAALFINVILEIHRGLMAMWAAILIFFLPTLQGSSSRIFGRTALTTSLALILTLILLGGTLRDLGYDPITKLTSTFYSATDIEREHWDRGRMISYAAATSVWLDHLWLGVGYDFLYNYFPVAMSPHNLFVTSLFHGGVIGTTILVSILWLCYVASIKLWRRSKNLPIKERLLNQTLVFTSWVWIIPLLTQEATLEKYSLSIQYIYFGIIVGLNRYYEKQSQNAIGDSEHK